MSMVASLLSIFVEYELIACVIAAVMIDDCESLSVSISF